MPTYQYVCTACDDRLEIVQRFSDDPLTQCGVCGGRLRKIFSAVGVVFKGSGFYRNDSRNDARVAYNGSGETAEKGEPEKREKSEKQETNAKEESGSSASSSAESGASGSSGTGSGSSSSPSGSAERGSGAKNKPGGNNKKDKADRNT